MGTGISSIFDSNLIYQINMILFRNETVTCGRAHWQLQLKLAPSGSHDCVTQADNPVLLEKWRVVTHQHRDNTERGWRRDAHTHAHLLLLGRLKQPLISTDPSEVCSGKTVHTFLNCALKSWEWGKRSLGCMLEMLWYDTGPPWRPYQTPLRANLVIGI